MASLLSYRLRRFKRGLLARLALASPRLSSLMSAPAPLVKMEYRGDARSRTLIVFLPGIGDLAEDFERRGFIAHLRREGIAADVAAVDAHYGYYASKAIFERMTDDVIAAAQDAGYEEIWLMGVSLGGFGAVSYAARHPGRVSGVLLLAPYLGGEALIAEIAAAGGMRGWEPGHVREDDYQRALWSWLKRHFASGAPAAGAPAAGAPALQIYLGYGAGDMFAPANALLAEALPKERVFVIPGRHDWRTWERIWRMFVAQWKTVER